MDMSNYKCPCCEGNLEFDDSLQKFKCRSCLNSYDSEIADFLEKSKRSDKYRFSLDNKDFGQKKWEHEAEKKLKVYKCPSCEEEFICESEKEVSKCIYCENDILLDGNFDESVCPDLIIPFNVGKEKAVNAFRRFCDKKPLLPEEFLKRDISKDMRGVYLPFWIFGGEGKVSAWYKGVKVSSEKDNKKEITKNSYFGVKRDGKFSFNEISLSGLKKYDSEIMKDLEPYFLSEAKEFSYNDLKGFSLGKFDLKKGIKEGLKADILSGFKESLKGFSAAELKSMDVNFEKSSVKCVLFPVWLMNIRYDGKIYSFAMNGQTGKVVGSLPISRSLYLRYFLLCFAVIAVIGVFIANII